MSWSMQRRMSLLAVFFWFYKACVSTREESLGLWESVSSADRTRRRDCNTKRCEKVLFFRLPRGDWRLSVCLSIGRPACAIDRPKLDLGAMGCVRDPATAVVRSLPIAVNAYCN